MIASEAPLERIQYIDLMEYMCRNIPLNRSLVRTCSRWGWSDCYWRLRAEPGWRRQAICGETHYPQWYEKARPFTSAMQILHAGPAAGPSPLIRRIRSPIHCAGI